MTESILGAGVRTNLLNISTTEKLASQTQVRIASGRRINDPTNDDVFAYYRAQQLASDSDNLDSVRAGLVSLRSVISSAISAIEAINTQLNQLVSIATRVSAITDTAQRTSATAQVKNVAVQIVSVVNSASTIGTNLLNTSTTTLNVRVDFVNATTIDAAAINLISTAANAPGGIFSNNADVFGTGGAFRFSGLFNAQTFQTATAANISDGIGLLRTAITRISGFSQTFATASSLATGRIAFNDQVVSTQRTAIDELVGADLNAESANLVALQTRQQLGIQAVMISNQLRQAALTLLR